MKLSLLFFSSLFALTTYGQGYHGDTWAKVRQSGSGKIVLVNTHIPKFATYENNQASGICFDVMNDFLAYVKSKYGVSIAIDYQPVSDRENFGLYMQTIKNSSNGVFGLGHTTITEKRKVEYEMSPSYFSNISVLLTERSVPNLSSLSSIGKEFQGMTAIVQKGSSHHQRLLALQKAHGGFDFAFVPNWRSNLEEVASSTNHFTYLDFPVYMVAITEGMSLKRQPVGDVSSEEFGIVMPKGSDWAPVLKEFFESNGGYTSSPAYQEVLERNLSEKILRLVTALSR